MADTLGNCLSQLHTLYKDPNIDVFDGLNDLRLHVAVVTFWGICFRHFAEPSTNAPINGCKCLAALACFRHAIGGDVSICLAFLLDNGRPMPNQWLVEKALEERPILLEIFSHLTFGDVNLVLKGFLFLEDCIIRVGINRA